MRYNQVIRELCGIVATVYRSIGNYNHASDCFCEDSETMRKDGNFKHDGVTITYIKTAVFEKLQKDGYIIQDATQCESAKSVS